MANTVHAITCAKCDEPIKGLVDAKPETVLACSSCGVSDTKENIEREVADYVASKASDAISDKLKGIASGHKWMTYEQGARDHKVYRFVVDYRPEI